MSGINMNELWHEARKKSGMIKDASTQTEIFKIDYFKKEIDKIVDHKTEGKKMGVRFMVKWKGYRFALPERSSSIIQRGGKDKLVAYMMELEIDNNRKFEHMLKNQPDLAELMDD